MLNYVDLSQKMTTVMDIMIEERETTLNPGQYPYPSDPGFSWWMNHYITNYDNDANNGDFEHSSVIMVPMPNLLKFQLTGANCDPMARSLANYWIAEVTHGSPEYDGIISVTNDAEKIFPIIRDYMCSYAASTGPLNLPGYQHLFRFIESVVNTIEWTVTEIDGDSTINYIVKIT